MVIPESGLVLEPNRLYLGRTVERTETHNLVPMIEGRSSIEMSAHAREPTDSAGTEPVSL